MSKFGYLVVEGPHDVEFMYRLLSTHGLGRVKMMDALDPFFVPLVPRSFPPDDDLQKRVPVPLFSQSGTHSVAVHSAIGDSRLIQTVEENAALVPLRVSRGQGGPFRFRYKTTAGCATLHWSSRVFARSGNS